MKTSLSHLPENKQHEFQRITDIIKEVVNPEKIILFGSYAKGTWVEDRYTDKHGTRYEYISDYDFLVVTRQNPEKTYSQESKIMDRVDRYEPPVNLEIHGLDYINKGLEEAEYFFVDIIREGILLYDKNYLQFASPKDLTPAEKKQKAERYFKTWFPQANEFIIDCNHAFNRDSLNKSAFELHQATESLYYATLLVFTDYKPKTHNLWKLRKKTKPYSKELFQIFRAETDKHEEHLFDLLKRGYVDARYRTDYVITKEELAALIQRITKMVLLVERICKDKIESFV
ncbi:HEPN domain-containing protein [Chryseosolibacter indicus]|uniref:HEPN domain-containing protein n=1 Tax=Chryseosolibacter indicus TaxID=2782351 RepID=A0ABS5VSQ7_9BACT|nr:HEPN domain-containing protein [Chryseosolibacter indicus]MBT1704447.1 HEPN domain-containing protein [Chryseosolibacter indicus]